MQGRARCLLVACLLAPPASFADAVDDLARTQMSRAHIPAMAVVVVRGGTVLKVAAYGTADLDWDAPASPRTAFQMASGTKPFTGLLLMKLVEQGKLRLDDALSAYVPNAPESWKGITIRHLATHTSGLIRDPGAPGPGKTFGSVDAAVSAATALPLEYETGLRSQYGLTDFVVLTWIMEKVSGRGFVELLGDEIVRPLGLQDTVFDDALDEGDRRSWLPVRQRATTYRWSGGIQRAYQFYYPKYTYSAGGLFSSASDIAKLLVALEQGRFLQSATLDELWTPATLKGGGNGEFAIGWVSARYRGLRAVGHSGGPALSDLLYFPELKLGIAVLTNQGSLFPILADLVADLYLPENARPDDPQPVDAEPQVTARLRALVAALAEGKIDEDAFSAEARQALIPMLREFGVPLVKQLDPLSEFRLIERKEEGGRTQYLYRAFFGKHPMRWRFALDKEGRIADLEPKTRD
jgi:CubicO group peptidase (beta-lactamase class C family)